MTPRELAAEVTRGPSVWDRPAWRGGVRALSATRLLQYTVPFTQVLLLPVPEGCRTWGSVALAFSGVPPPPSRARKKTQVRGGRVNVCPLLYNALTV